MIDNLGMGGAEAWLMALLRYWRCAGQSAPQIDFLATGAKPGLFDDEARALGARIFYVPYSWRKFGAFAGGLRRVLRQGDYDAIHDHQDYASGWHLLLGAGELPPVRVAHVHNPSYQVRENYSVNLRRRTAGKFGQALIARFATHITGTSRQAITEHGFDTPAFDRIPKAALHCGFDPAPFLTSRTAARAQVCGEFGWPTDANIVLVAGRIDVSPDVGHPRNHKNSGFAVAIGIAAAHRSEGVRFLFAGAPSEATPVLKQRIAAAGLVGRIVFAGVRRDMPKLMAASDVLFFPSRGEGLGMVAVEAQAAGLPVLASTEVPRECVVVPELVRFQDLDAGPGVWVRDLLELSAQQRVVDTANAKVAASSFAIERSARALRALYGEGQLP